MSWYPFENPLGFGAVDFIELALICAMLVAAFAWKPSIAVAYSKLAGRTLLCMIALALIPVALRLALLRTHPVPAPDIYDEFSHLLVADTLRHFRLANPPHPLHRFFETFFVLQEPTYSSIYPLGQGIVLAVGRALFGHPWAGVLMTTAAFSALCYWMLLGWVAPEWALAGGVICAIQFGPLCLWTNNYWGGAPAAAAGCLVFGALPRLKSTNRPVYAVILAAGLGFSLIIRPYESIFLFASAFAFSLQSLSRKTILSIATTTLPFVALILAHNHSVTGSWTTLPYSLSQFQYGVPASLTFQAIPVPHRELTREQRLEYESQLAFRTSERETITSYLLRLEYRVRFYRFFFATPFFLALVFLIPAIRNSAMIWLIATVLVVSLGVNFFPAFQFHYLAPIACLFVLMVVTGLDALSRVKPGGAEAAGFLILLFVFQFVFWYTMHAFDDREFSRFARQYETWAGINHGVPERRAAVNRELAEIPGRLLVFVHYSPQHIFQDEWVYNEADIEHARIVWARDLGPDENQKLRAYYPDRKALLLEPDARPPRLTEY